MHLFGNRFDLIGLAANLALRVHGAGQYRNLKTERHAANFGKAASSNFFDFADTAADNRAVIAAIRQAQGQAFGEQTVQLAGQHVEPIDRNHEVQTVGFALPRQRNKGFQQIAFVVFFLGRVAKRFDIFGEVVNNHQQGRNAWLDVAAVVFIQR